ncbi:MAG TPA: branched-chain amino acid ABC transporter permease [Candidatus Methylomirabilis sp.]|nr:branched-chain amino acid ABC transporter permease [Candidatus Methylomirabilis sp.]
MSAPTRSQGSMLSALRFIPRRSLYVLAGVAVIAAIVAFTVTDKFYLHLLIMMLFYAAVSSAWNIVGGFAGQLSLGHAAFFGIGAYTSTLMFIDLGISPWIGMLIGAALATLISGAIGYPSFRLRGPFFTLVTIAFAEVLRILTIYAHDFTKGSIGISVPFRPAVGNFIFRQLSAYIFVALVFLVIAVLVSLWIEHSRLGYYLAALREDEDAAQALGIDTARYKLVAVLISAFLTALAGTFYAQYIFYIEPFQTFSLDFSVLLAMMAIIGGVGTVWGPVAGAFLVTPLQEVLQARLGGHLQGLHLVIYGTVLIVVVILLPQGIVPTIAAWGRRMIGRQRARPAPELRGDA